MRIPSPLSNRSCWAAVAACGLLLATFPACADIVFQADFNGPGSGTGHGTNLVAVGGTGVIQADGVNTLCFVTNDPPFTPAGSNFLRVDKLSSGGPYAPVLFTFGAETNCWQAWQGPDILDANGINNISLRGAYDLFFRVNSSNSTNDMSSIRTLQQYSWSDGGNGLGIVMNGQVGGYMILQIKNAGFNLGVTPQAITDFTSSGGNLAYYPQYDEIDAYFNPSEQLTNGLPYHIGFTFDTDANGFITLGLYLKQGTGAIDTTVDRLGWANFRILAGQLSDWSGNLTDVCFTNQAWNFAAGWAASGPFVTDYAQNRIYDSVPSSFTALPGTPVESLMLFPPVIADGNITLTWRGTGRLQWAPTVEGPWTDYTPTPESGYTEPLIDGARFYRLVSP